jgi:DNA-directed RNA polymerase subunit L
MRCGVPNAATLKNVKSRLIMEKRKYNTKRRPVKVKIKVLKKTANELKIEIEGAEHGLCNLLQKKLLEDKSVDMAGYDIPHPLASNPVIYVRMKGAAKPEQALKKAAEKAREANEAFSNALEKALKA